MTRVLYENIRRVVMISDNKVKVITCAVQGPDAIPPETYMAHMDNTDNPHRVGLFQLLIPAGNNGQWLRFSDDGSALIPTSPPLTEMPVLPQPIDEKVKAWAGDPTSTHLNQKIAGVLYIDEENHVLRLRGDLNIGYAPNHYYGTNDEGQFGFWEIPSGLIQVSGIGIEDENEWLNSGELNFFDLP